MSSPSPKRIRSQPPDVIVAVGHGNAQEEFECYKVVLSFASPVLDAMLSADMTESNTSRIEFPQKDPEEWKLFYRFIDPEMIGTADYDALMTLTPWFHEFQMDTHVGQCDRLLKKKVVILSKKREGLGYPYDKSYWDKAHVKTGPGVWRERKKAFVDILQILQFAYIYDLTGTKTEAENFIMYLLRDELMETIDLFSLPAITSLVDLFLPIEEEEEGQFQPKGKSTTFWDVISEYGVFDDIPFASMNNKDLLALIIRPNMKLQAKAEELSVCRSLGRSVMRDWVRASPNKLINRLGKRNNVVGAGAAGDDLKHILHEHYQENKDSFRVFGVTVPDSYKN